MWNLLFVIVAILTLAAVTAFLLQVRYARRINRRVPQRSTQKRDIHIENDEPMKMIECYNPATGEKLGSVPAMSAAEVNARVAIAREEQQAAWQHTTLSERRRVLRALLKKIVDNQHRIVAESMNDTGKAMWEAYLGEIMISCEKIRYIIKHAGQFIAPESRHVPLLLRFVKKAFVEYTPAGVIGVIIPWNYPFHNILGPIATALFCGNAVVVKVSEYTAWSTHNCYADLIHSALIECGYSPDLVQFIQGFGDAGAALARSKVDHILFIGSPQTGKRVMLAAASNLTPVTLELGGKDAYIVCDDADVAHAADTALRSVFLNCGQNCVAAERFFVHRKVYQQFSDAVAKAARMMRQGPPSIEEVIGDQDVIDIGAMTMQSQIDKVEALVNDAVAKGAKVLAGGKRNTSEECARGQFFMPTVLADVTPDMDIAREETFGPVLPIIPFDDDKEVIQMANNSEFGLGGYVFSSNYNRAMHLARQLDCGVTMLNDHGLFYLVQSCPFGGVKDSGFGRFNGPEGYRAFCRQKTIVVDRFPFVTSTPGFLKYPVWASSHLMIRELICMFYSDSWKQKLTALVNFTKLALTSKKPKLD